MHFAYGNTIQIGKRVWQEILRQKKVENRRNTLCIARFSQRISGGKDPSESADAFVWCCLTEKASQTGNPIWEADMQTQFIF